MSDEGAKIAKLVFTCVECSHFVKCNMPQKEQLVPCSELQPECCGKKTKIIMRRFQGNGHLIAGTYTCDSCKGTITFPSTGENES